MTKDQVDQLLKNRNVYAFLKMLMVGETDPDTDEAYQALFGWKKGNGKIFTDFSKHPAIRTYEKYDGQFIKNGKIDYTTAAGALQITESTWKGLVRRNPWLTDFGPHNQLLAGILLIIGRGALADVLAGRVEAAIAKLGQEWASLPSSTVGQPTAKLAKLVSTYTRFGGLATPVEAAPQQTAQAELDIGQATTPSPAPQTTPGESADQPAEPDWGEPPRTAAQAQGKKPMAPLLSAFTGAAFDAVLAAAPKLLDLFRGDSEVAKRNVDAVKMIVDVAKTATSSPNEQALVENLATDPAAVEALQQAVERNWFELHEATEKSIATSRKFIVDYSKVTDVRTVALNLTFIELLTMFFAIAGMGGGLAVLLWGNLDDSLEGAIITLMLIESVVGVRKAWIGNTPGTPPADEQPARKTG